MLQNPKRFCNVVSLQMNVALMHLERTMTGRQRRAFSRYSLPGPCRLCTMPKIMKPKVFDFCISAGAFQCSADRVFVDPLSILARENKSVDVPDP